MTPNYQKKKEKKKYKGSFGTWLFPQIGMLFAKVVRGNLDASGLHLSFSNSLLRKGIEFLVQWIGKYIPKGSNKERSIRVYNQLNLSYNLFTLVNRLDA